jgi:AbrB family looped-hinge helix DNA binding protein
MGITATITSKGQVTIPKAIRDRLRSRVVEFVIEDDHIEIRPVKSAEGGLAGFAAAYVPIEEVREQVWGKSNG